MKKILFLSVFMLMLTIILADTITIGNGTSTQRFPLGTYHGYERSAALYKDSDLGAQNIRISKLAWYSQTLVTAETPTKIYLKKTSGTSFSAGTWSNMIANATLVWDHTHSSTLAGGWNEFILDNTYDVEDGLGVLVLVERNKGGTGGGTVNGASITYTSTTSCHETWGSDNNPPTDTDNGTVGDYRPNIEITYSTFSTTVSTFPYSEGFENGNLPNTGIAGWTQESGSYIWTANKSYTDYNRSPRTGSWNAFLHYGGSRWMFRPLQLEANKHYRVSLWARQDKSSSSYANIKICYGTTASAAEMTNTILNTTGITNGNYQNLVGTFSPSSSGVFYLGIYGTISTSAYYLSVDDISISSYLPSNTPTTIGGVNVTSSIEVDINGNIDETNPTVQALPNYASMDNPVVFGLSGVGTGNLDIQVGVGTWYGISYYGGTWHQANNYPLVVESGTGNLNFTGVDFGAKGDVIIVLNEGENPTLPVELSAFTVNVNTQNGINVMWVTESETGVNGYYVQRGMVDALAQATVVSPLIPAANTSEQQVYLYTDKEIYEPGTYYYWLEAVDYDGYVNYYGPRSVYFTGPHSSTPEIPLVTGIRSFFPNPFNPVATIIYELSQPAEVKIDIYNTRGQIVRNFALGQKEKGSYKLLWEGDDDYGRHCANGIYYIRMYANQETFIKKVTLLK